MTRSGRRAGLQHRRCPRGPRGTPAASARLPHEPDRRVRHRPARRQARSSGEVLQPGHGPRSGHVPRGCSERARRRHRASGSMRPRVAGPDAVVRRRRLPRWPCRRLPRRWSTGGVPSRRASGCGPPAAPRGGADQEAPAPQRIAPFAPGVGADVVVGGEELATGRLVLLHDPAGQDAWGGHFRVVTFIRAALEPEIAADPLLGQSAGPGSRGAAHRRRAAHRRQRHRHPGGLGVLRSAGGPPSHGGGRGPGLLDPAGRRRAAPAGLVRPADLHGEPALPPAAGTACATAPAGSRRACAHALAAAQVTRTAASTIPQTATTGRPPERSSRRGPA